MVAALNKAYGRIRRTRGSSFLTHGADDYDHKGLNKAYRQLSKALIEEAFDDDEEIEMPIHKWVLRVYYRDDEKPWKSDWFISAMFDKQSEMNAHLAEMASRNEELAKKYEGFEPLQTHWEYMDIRNDYEALRWYEDKLGSKK